jgi:hypothetical protein
MAGRHQFCGMTRLFVKDGGPRGGMVFEYLNATTGEMWLLPRDAKAPPCVPVASSPDSEGEA